MIAKLLFIALLVIFGRIAAQICVPSPVEEISLDENGILSWSESTNCPDTTYEIVIKTGGIIEYEYNVDSSSLDVSFLKLCRVYTFAVTPVADHVLGLEISINGTINLDNDIVIAIENFTADPIADDILLQWHVNPNHTDCVGFYNLRIWDEDSTTPTSVYVGQSGYYIEHVAHCMEYRLEITPFYNSTNGTTGEFNFTVPAKTNFPTLVELRQSATQINTTWSLEKYNVNRCNVTSLNVTSTHFDVKYEIEDSPGRPDIQVSIPNLRANSMYYFNVITNNTAGESTPFQLAVQTLAV